MTVEAFIEALEKISFLGDERRQLLIDNAQWMTAPEREQALKDISEMAKEWDKNEEEMAEELTKVEEVIKKFKKEELPEMMKKEESTETEEEEEKAKKLLESFDDSSD